MVVYATYYNNKTSAFIQHEKKTKRILANS